jgi:hypothetical protein
VGFDEVAFDDVSHTANINDFILLRGNVEK